jgi:hypothetical protein
LCCFLLLLRSEVFQSVVLTSASYIIVKIGQPVSANQHTTSQSRLHIQTMFFIVQNMLYIPSFRKAIIWYRHKTLIENKKFIYKILREDKRYFLKI